MRTAKVKSRSSQKARGHVKKLAALVVSSTGPAPHKQVLIRLQSGTLKTVEDKSEHMTALIERYGAAVKESREIGKSISFVVDVEPSGESHFRSLESAARPSTGAADEAASDLRTALAAARERGQARVADILSRPDMLSADQFAKLLGTSRVTVNAKRQRHEVLGLDGAKRGFRFPKWQIGDDGKPFSALPRLFDLLGGSPLAVYRFLVQRHPEFDGLTGRDVLSRGRAAEAFEAAESVVRTAS